MKRVLKQLQKSTEADPNAQRSLVLFLGVALILRVASIFLLHTYRHPNTWEFGQIAHVIASGNGYTVISESGVRIPSAYMPPLYPYLLSAVWRTFGESSKSYLGIELLQALFGVLLVFSIFRLTTLLFNTRVGIFAAAVTSVWPSFVYLCNEMHSINFYIVLSVASAYYVTRYIEVSRALGDIVCAGLMVGALFYCRGETGSLLVLYVAILIWRRGKDVIPHAFLLCAVALVCIAPWAVRNYRVFGHFVLVATSAGSNLLVGHNAHARGDFAWKADYETPEQRHASYALSSQRDAEVVINQLNEQYAVDYARTHPVREIALTGRKAFYFLLFDPTHPKGRKVLYWGPSLTLLLFAVYGGWLHRHCLLNRDLVIVATLALAFLLSLVVFALPRYRIASDPFLVPLAAYAAVTLVDAIKIRKKRMSMSA